MGTLIIMLVLVVVGVTTILFTMAKLRERFELEQPALRAHPQRLRRAERHHEEREHVERAA